MRVLFVNNDGGGFSDHIEEAKGTTIMALFHERMDEATADSRA